MVWTSITVAIRRLEIGRRAAGGASVLAPAAFVAGLPWLALAQPAPAAAPLEAVTVVALSPLPGTSIDADTLPGEVQALSVERLTRDRGPGVVADLAGGQLAGVALDHEQGSVFQPDLVFRGFEASPISGVAQGVAVYQDGVRLNETFGDTVNWDLIPTFAVQSFTLQSDNPVFGLNALGGAVTLAMKDGFGFTGADAEVSGGSFGAGAGDAEQAARFGDFGLYLGLGGQHDGGFRERSPATLGQAFGDLAYERGALTVHLTASGALSDIAATGPTPVQLLARDPRAVFTFPQSTRNEAELVQLRGAWMAGGRLSFAAGLSWRRFAQHLVDGNTTDVNFCAQNASQLCLGGDDAFPGDALYDSNGRPVAASVLPPGATPGETDFTHTLTNTIGASIQATATTPFAGRANTLVVGAALDRGVTSYQAYGELGSLRDNLEVVGAGVVIDQALSPTARPPIEAPVNVDARNTYVGLYAIDVIDVTPRLFWTVSGRWNFAEVGLTDRLGGALTSDHRFDRFNPGTGLAYRVTGGLTAYAGYSEASRVPTPGELSCADPAAPCLLGAFLVSDPDLKPVASQTFEAGLRGRFAVDSLPGSFSWSVSAYRTISSNDILLLATPINGFGYFRNAGATRRRGVDARLGYRDRRWTLSAGFAWLDATFRDAETLSSNSPAADAAGLIFVRPGDTLPLNPAKRLTVSADYEVTGAWSVGADLRAQSGQYLAGDASNQEAPIPGFATVGVQTLYRLNRRVEVFGEITNLFDRRYYTFGAFAGLDNLPPNFALTNPRTYSPAQGRAITIGARVRFD